MERTIPHRTYLTEEQLPKAWYNVRAAMKNKPAPMLDPKTKKPLKPDEMRAIFCDKAIEHELDNDTEYFTIPEAVMDIYKQYRPSPLCRAYELEKKLGTPARIYYKFEGNNTSGSHKLNAAVAEAYFAKEQGVKYLTTETGAGQWGTALSEACGYFDIPLKVFMVKVSYEQKPFRKAIMRTFGADTVASPSETTEIGKRILQMYPGTSGSLGTAISEAVEVAVKDDGGRYVLGSVMNHVAMYQSVIGLEAETAMKQLGEYPDVVIGCAGGGSNLAGLIAPFMRDKLEGKKNPRIVAVEPSSCPSLTRGRFAYDYCDTGRITPLAKMYTLGNGFIPSSDHAGGLRYHGMSPILSQLYHDGYMEAVNVKQTDIFDAAVMFAKVETILPAPESAHAILGAINEALECKRTGEEKVILFGLTGTGYFDMKAYSAYMDGTMVDHDLTDAELQKGFDTLPDME